MSLIARKLLAKRFMTSSLVFLLLIFGDESADMSLLIDTMIALHRRKYILIMCYIPYFKNIILYYNIGTLWRAGLFIRRGSYGVKATGELVLASK